jgi:hypothetical protein
MALKELHLSGCNALTRLPLSFAFLSDALSVCSWSPLAFPPLDIARQGMPAIRAFLLIRHHPLKMLLLILAARRRRRMRHLPSELWVLIRDEFL